MRWRRRWCRGDGQGVWPPHRSGAPRDLSGPVCGRPRRPRWWAGSWELAAEAAGLGLLHPAAARSRLAGELESLCSIIRLANGKEFRGETGRGRRTGRRTGGQGGRDGGAPLCKASQGLPPREAMVPPARSSSSFHLVAASLGLRSRTPLFRSYACWRRRPAVRLWDVETMQETAQNKNHRNVVSHAAAVPGEPAVLQASEGR